MAYRTGPFLNQVMPLLGRGTMPSSERWKGRADHSLADVPPLDVFFHGTPGLPQALNIPA